jgi:hypothetical protein
MPISRRRQSGRAKLFGRGHGTPLDRNAKVRIVAYAEAYTARHRQPGQHRGPITRAALDVLKALLWGFHNAHSGECFPSYETIAARAKCHRDTVAAAIKSLEAARVLTWCNRLARIETRERDLIGVMVRRRKVIRTSNAYSFRDPNPQAAARQSSKSENPTGTENQEILSLAAEPRVIVLDPDDPLDLALIRLSRSIAKKEADKKAPGMG